MIDADVASVSGAADKVLHVRGDPEYLLHLEFVSGHDASELPELLHWRATLLAHRHRAHVRILVVLLHPGADSPALTGLYEVAFPGEVPYLRYQYQVLRLWQVPARRLLAEGPGAWHRSAR